MIPRLTFIVLFTLAVATAMAQNAPTIMDAVNKSDTVLLKELIRVGLPFNLADENGTTPLMKACRWGDEPIARMLLKAGATVDIPRSNKGRTALMVACAYYSGKTICKMLIERGADVNATAQDGSTPLMLAAMNFKVDVVQLLLMYNADPLKKDTQGLTALDYAIRAEWNVLLTESVKDTRLDKEEVINLLTQAIKN